VIEVGAGNGLNFSHYPSTVTEVVAVEPESFLRAQAEEAARSVSVPMTILDGTADALPVPDAANPHPLTSTSPSSHSPSDAVLSRLVLAI
jgi:hypothetical protein